MSNETKTEAAPELLNKTIADVLAERITIFSTSPKMLEIIDKKIESCMTSVVDDVFGRYSDFSKSAEKAFKASLPGNIDSVVDLGRYNSMVEQRLRDAFANSGIANDMVQKAEAVLKEAMDEKLLPPVIKLSAFIEAYIEGNAQRASEEGWEKPDLRFHDDDNSYLTRDYKDFYFEENIEGGSRYSSYSSRSIHSLKNYLRLRSIDGEMFEGEQVYEVWSAKIDDEYVQKIVSISSHLSGWEKMVFALFYGQSKIIIDCDPEDYSYPGYND